MVQNVTAVLGVYWVPTVDAVHVYTAVPGVDAVCSVYSVPAVDAVPVVD